MMKCLLILLTVILLVLPAAAVAQGQDDREWRVVRVQSLYERVIDLIGRPLFFAAPNGRQFAYGGRGQGDDATDEVCTVGIALPMPVCVPIPREMAYSYNVDDVFPSMRWSPDSTKIAIVGEPYKFFKDTDLGVVDFGQMAFTNIADDQFLGSVMFDDQAPDEFIVDSQIAWSPDGARIALERTRVTKELGLANTEIVIVDAATGEELQAVRHPLWGPEKGPGAGTTVAMDWSPDGSTLALSIRGVKGDVPQNGLWLLDVAGGTLTQILTFPQITETLSSFDPTISSDNPIFAVIGLRWSPDGSRLLAWHYNPAIRAAFQTLFWIDPASGSISVLELPRTSDADVGIPTVIPLSAAWSPDGSRVLVLAHNLENPDASDFLPLVDGDFSVGIMSLHLVDPATGDSQLLGHLPAAPGPAFVGEWGTDGSAILGAFQVEFARE